MKTLIISDLHFPYAHKDSLPFLKAVKSWLKPDRVVNIGDEVDYHAISFHDKDPDLDNATQELLRAREDIKKLEKLFPKMDLLHSNHGSLVFRKRKYHGLPDYIIKDYADILDVNKKNWKWHDKLILHDKYGSYYFVHNMNKDPLKSSMSIGMNFIQGHYHTDFQIKYWSSPEALKWGLSVGCLIDKDSLAFAYSRVNIRRPILGCAYIEDGIPNLIPMVLKKGNRWIGKI
ncbi:MAG: phosphoesterase [Gammaproteobacteria bacterium]|nr:phosphoesterase [Gammaproteobacteria bacterium]|tara:strand:+ start:374 stop:1066 length:693 start_codon:yes stop_codon:yes gene_type:complete